jgi:hypothetical protein
MAYKYFTKELLAKSNEVDIANIFADKQNLAKEKLNTNYSLPQIVDWVKENTNNFKKSENYFIDLDQAIKRVVFKYYESTNKVNPFADSVQIEEIETQPRIPTEVSISGVKTGKADVTTKEEVVEQIADSIENQIASAIEGIKVMLEIDPDNEDYKESLMQLELTLETLK